MGRSSFPDYSTRSLAEVFSLSGRSAVVTGGANGIGRAICMRMAEAGAAVLVADVDQERAVEVAAAIVGSGGRAESIALDARDSADHARVASHAVENFGSMDIWVNDAGVYPIKPALEITSEDWEYVVGLNLAGSFYGAQAAARRMKGGGVIVMIASSLGYHGVKQQASYVASKFGVRGLVSALALEWAELGIRVLAIGPGMIDVPSMRDAAETMGAPDDPFAMYARANPSGRAGVPDDIARAIVFAVSDAAGWATGSTLLIDGGEVASGGMA